MERSARPALETAALAVELARHALSVAPHAAVAERQRTLVLTLLAQATNLHEQGDPGALERAEASTDEAGSLLDVLHEEGAARAWYCVLKAMALYHGDATGQLGEVLTRGLAAAAADPDTDIRHRSSLERMQLELDAETADDARLAAIVDAIHAQLPKPEQTYGLTEAMARVRAAEWSARVAQWDIALADAVIGLEGVLRWAPAGTETLRAVSIAADARANAGPEEDRLVDVLFARQAAVAVQDVRRLLLDEPVLEVDIEEAASASAVREVYLDLLLSLGGVREALRAADTGRAMALSTMLRSESGT